MIRRAKSVEYLPALSTDLFAEELIVLKAFAIGSGLQELYITRDKVKTTWIGTTYVESKSACGCEEEPQI